MAKTDDFEFGIDTFGDLAYQDDGKLMNYAGALRLVVEEAVLADKLGIDVIGLGEHHRDEFAISSPEMVLSAIASRTKRIKLASAVTVLSSDDPVRVFERFSTLDAISNGRAQVILGRGSFTESFPLFGYDLRDYEQLFDEKIELFSKLLAEKPVTWSGTMRPALDGADVFPKTESGRLKTMVGVGGSPKSVVRAAMYGFPLMLAIIGGSPERFRPYKELYERAAKEFGHPVHPVGMHSHGYIAEDDKTAVNELYLPYARAMDKIGKTRGWPPMRREQYLAEVEHGSLYVGSPETVAQKIAHAMQAVGASRFDMVYGIGQMPASARKRTIEMYAREVIPRVKELLASGKD